MKRRVATGGKSIKARRRKTLRRRATPAVLRRKHSRDTELRAQLDHSKRERDEALAREAATADVLKRRTRELDETREQQTATTNVLKAISHSAIDLQAVLDALAEFVASLCLADRVAIRLEKGGAYHHLASFGFSAEQKTYMKNHAWRPDRSSVGGRAVLQGEAVHVEDIKDDPEFKLMAGRSFKNVRTALGVPLIRDSKPIGAMVLTRRVVQPFTDRHIELATTFAAQAVIAIENARLLNELRQRTDDLSESLEQQTATSEVLKVISSSPGELAPVFQAMLENATRICEASFGNLLLYENGLLRRVAFHNTPTPYTEFNETNPLLDPEKVPTLGRLVQTKQAVQVADIAVVEPDSPIFHLGGARTLLVVPMLKDDVLVGGIGIYRKEVRPFTDKQVELVSNFAAQAVIAIENTRLLGELRESLEQQTATSEILGVISSAPGELEPVFNAILKNATRLCDAKFGNLFLYRDGKFFPTALLDAPPALADHIRKNEWQGFAPEPGVGLGRILRTKALVHILDDRLEPHPGPACRFGGARSLVAVPMLKEREVVGAFIIYRQEVRAFTDAQIELVQNFAAQAVIAIENTRLLSELRKSLQQQTATSEVLQVISSSPGELQPVFDAMLENATRLCGAKFSSLMLVEGDQLRRVALHNAPSALVEHWRSMPLFRPHPKSAAGRAAATKQVAFDDDLRTTQRYRDGEPLVVAGVELGGYRAVMSVPMVKDDVLVGIISIYRQEVLSFTDKQIELVTELRRPGCHRHREHAAAQRAAQVASTADRYCRCAQGHQSVDLQSSDRIGYARRIGCSIVRGRYCVNQPPAW